MAHYTVNSISMTRFHDSVHIFHCKVIGPNVSLEYNISTVRNMQTVCMLKMSYYNCQNVLLNTVSHNAMHYS